MYTCKTCGQTYSDPVKFCGKCGGDQFEAQQQGGYQQNYYQQPNYVDESGLFSENKMARVNGTSATMKLGDWLKVDCLSLLSLIPCIGTIAYFVILCILTFSSKTNKSLKARYHLQ